MVYFAATGTGDLLRHLKKKHNISPDVLKSGNVDILENYDADENGYICLYCKKFFEHKNDDNQELILHYHDYHSGNIVSSNF